MISPEAAWNIVLRQVRPLPAVKLPMAHALSRYLVQDVKADRDLPPADRSSVDGYAVRLSDLESCPCVLRVAGELPAGSAQRPRVRAGSCVRIYTGANIPPGADAVVMVEETQEAKGKVTIQTSVPAASNILRRAANGRKGAVLVPRGTCVGAAEVGVCAAVGKHVVEVYGQPRVAILCTGSELLRGHERALPHQARDSNGPALAAALADWGFPSVKSLRVADKPAVLVTALRRALKSHEVVLFSGGVSIGRYDFVREAVEAVGATIRFHGVAMRPGKPTLYATAPARRHIFGLPGNPLSALTAFHEFALPALRRLAGASTGACRPIWRMPLVTSTVGEPARARRQLARLVTPEGSLAVFPVHSRSSADLVAAGSADGVILLAAGTTHFAAGQLVEFRPWRRVP